jgi:hypothetical protein
LSQQNYEEDHLQRGGASILMSRTDIVNLVAKLKFTIDRLDSDFKKAKDQILELARMLDESKQCERSHISRKIKELLEEKIKHGKITPKWIQDCLPSEYKREYNKREVTSLLAAANDTEESTEKGITEGKPLQQEYTDSKGFEVQSEQKEKQVEKIKQQGQIMKEEQILKDQQKELEKLRPLVEEQQKQESRLRKENVDLKEQLEKLQEEITKLRTGT